MVLLHALSLLLLSLASSHVVCSLIPYSAHRTALWCGISDHPQLVSLLFGFLFFFFFLQGDNADQHRHSILLSCHDPCGTTLPRPCSQLHNFSSHPPSIPKHPCHLPLLKRVHPCSALYKRQTAFAVFSFVRPEKIVFHFVWGIRCFNQRLRTEGPAILSAAVQGCFGSSLSSQSGWSLQGQTGNGVQGIARCFVFLHVTNLVFVCFYVGNNWRGFVSRSGVCRVPGTANHSWFPSGQNGHTVPSC